MSGRASLRSRDCSPLFSATPSFWESEKQRRENENKRLWNKWKTQLCVYLLNKSSIQIAFCWGPISQRGIKTQLHLQSYISISHPVSFSVQHISHREQEKPWFVCLGGIRGRWCCDVDGWLHSDLWFTSLKLPSTKTKASSIHFICLLTSYKGGTYGLICFWLSFL